MIAVTGITGRIGGSLADRLLAAGVGVRAVVREAAKGESWRKKGCEVAVADLSDVGALTAAFKGVEAVFVLLPPIFDPQPGFSEAYTVVSAVRDAIRNAAAARVVYLSTVGAQARETNLLTQHTVGEALLSELEVPVTFLRPAWFLENIAWDLASARNDGFIQSYLQPLDRAIPMVGVYDIGRLAADLIVERWAGHRVVELEGNARISPLDLGRMLTILLGRDVEVRAVPRASWESLFRESGMQNPYPRIRMLDGFNEGWIDFEGGPGRLRKGHIAAEEVLRELIEKTAA